MAKKGHSEPGLFGGINHYDEHGKKVGHSEPGLFGGMNHYDNKGNKIGHSDPGLFGGMNHYDSKGNKTGHSDPGLLGGYTHYDSKGNKTGSSDPGLFGGYNHRDSQGCYIATCVYGSYDCPQVWVLRRYRDYYLYERAWGRIFIEFYYAVSPTIVKLFGRYSIFQKLWTPFLDKRISKLKMLGVSDEPYNDRNYR